MRVAGAGKKAGAALGGAVAGAALLLVALAGAAVLLVALAGAALFTSLRSSLSLRIAFSRLTPYSASVRELGSNRE